MKRQRPDVVSALSALSALVVRRLEGPLGWRGWRRAVTLVLLGAVTALSQPPAGAWPVLFLTVPGFLAYLERARNWRDGLAIGWLWGYGYFVAGLYWIGLALLVDAERFAWILPLADLGLPVYFALFPALAAGCAVVIGRQGVTLVFALAGCFYGAEWLRGHLLTGFAWNLLAATWIDVPVMAQGAAVIGSYGLSALTLLLTGLPVLALRPQGQRHHLRPALWISAVAVLGLMAWGLRALDAVPMARRQPAVTFRIVQANIPMGLKMSNAGSAEAFRRHMALSAQPYAGGKPDLLIWPETALPYRLEDDARLAPLLGDLVNAKGVALIGAVRTAADDAAGGPGFKAWNSLHAIAADGRVLATYDKFHLVPFGEYLPLRPLLAAIGLQSVAAGAVDFSAGPGPLTLTLGSLPAVSPLICYEVIFPDRVIADGPRPSWIVTITNDAWFGRSSGPYQHLAAARLRAIEQGLPVIRAANTGISAVIDAHGRIEQALPLETAGVIDGRLPPAIAPPPYTRFGEWPSALFALISCLWSWRQKGQSQA